MTPKALSPTTSSFHLFDDRLALGETRGISLLLRYRNRQKQINGHTERPTDLLMQRYRTLALSRFEIGEIALLDADGDRKLVLRHGAPLAQNADRILARRQPINKSLGHQDLSTCRN